MYTYVKHVSDRCVFVCGVKQLHKAILCLRNRDTNEIQESYTFKVGYGDSNEIVLQTVGIYWPPLVFVFAFAFVFCCCSCVFKLFMHACAKQNK